MDNRQRFWEEQEELALTKISKQLDALDDIVRIIDKKPSLTKLTLGMIKTGLCFLDQPLEEKQRSGLINSLTGMVDKLIEMEDDDEDN